MHPKIRKPTLLLYKTGSFGKFWVRVLAKVSKTFRINRSPKSFSKFSRLSSRGDRGGSTRPGDAGRGAASLPPGENLSRSYTPSFLGGGSGSGGSAPDARVKDPRKIPGLAREHAVRAGDTAHGAALRPAH